MIETTTSWNVDFGNPADFGHVTIEVPDSVIAAASNWSYENDEFAVIGEHPYFGWVYRDNRDFGAIAELGGSGAVIRCDSYGLVEDKLNKAVAG